MAVGVMPGLGLDVGLASIARVGLAGTVIARRPQSPERTLRSAVCSAGFTVKDQPDTFTATQWVAYPHVSCGASQPDGSFEPRARADLVVTTPRLQR